MFDLLDGSGGGRAEITSYISSTVVHATILTAFSNDGTIFAAGDWFLTATTVSGLEYLEGETVGVVTDGAVTDDEVVTNGAITFAEPASVVHVGYRFRGMLKTLPIDQGGVSGPASDKNKNISQIGIRFSNSSGCEFGTSPYELQEFSMRSLNDVTGRPIPLYTGTVTETYEDDWEEDKQVFIVQNNPSPCTVVALDFYSETTDE